MSSTDPTIVTYATLRIWGSIVSAHQVTSILGIQPTDSHEIGDRRGQKGIWNSGYWELCSKEDIKSDKLVDHVEWLIDKIVTKKKELQQIKLTGDRVDIFCFFVCESANCAISLSTNVLKTLAFLELDLEIDIYT